MALLADGNIFTITQRWDADKQQVVPVIIVIYYEGWRIVQQGETLVTLTAHIWSGRGVTGTRQPVSSCSRVWLQEVSHPDGNVTSELQQVNRTRKQHVLSDHNNSDTSARGRQPQRTRPGRLTVSRTRFHGEYRSALAKTRVAFMVNTLFQYCLVCPPG